jgi:hypothetical protein
LNEAKGLWIVEIWKWIFLGISHFILLIWTEAENNWQSLLEQSMAAMNSTQYSTMGMATDHSKMAVEPPSPTLPITATAINSVCHLFLYFFKLNLNNHNFRRVF